MTSPLASVPELVPSGPSRQQRGIRVPQLLLSLLVVAVFALLAVWWQANATARTPAIALANDVQIGVPLVRSDLTEIYINTDVPALVEDPQFLEAFIGVVPRVDLEAGTLITDSMFRRSTALGPNQGLVGLRLDADEAPSSLVPGDRVQVLSQGPTGEAVVLALDAEIESVSATRDIGTVAVQLRLGVEEAQLVQLAAEDVVVIEVENIGEPSWKLDPELGSAEPEGDS